MAVSGPTAASSFQPATLQMSSLTAPHRHSGHRASAISDVDAQSSSVATTVNFGRQVGNMVDVKA